MTTGEKIAALRREKGLSQEALGEQLGLSRQAVSKWEAEDLLCTGAHEKDKVVHHRACRGAAGKCAGQSLCHDARAGDAGADR